MLSNHLNKTLWRKETAENITNNGEHFNCQQIKWK